MSQTLYLVRLREVFRLREIYDVRVDRIPPEAIFATRQAADSYTKTHLPLANNPFARTNETLFVKPEEGMIYVDMLGGDDATSRCYDYFTFIERLVQEGIDPPDDWDFEPKTWGQWWDVVNRGKDSKQKSEIRQRLQLPDWGENPFTRARVTIAEDVCLTYTVPLVELNNLIHSWGIIPPEIAQSTGSWHDLWAAEDSLVNWWDENAPRMTDDQKAALWRLLDPQPWEIVEVELETGEQP